MKETALKLIKFWLNHKKGLLSGLFSVFLVSISLAVEANVSDFKLVQSKVSLFENYEKVNQVEIEPAFASKPYIKYDFDEAYQDFDLNNNKAPKYIKTEQDPATLKFLNSAYLAIAPESELRTLVFTKNKFHAEIQSGKVILNNLTETSPITLQVSNVLVQPNMNSVILVSYIDSNLKVEVLKGNAVTTVYDEDGIQLRKINLATSNRISTFDSFAAEGDIQIEKPIEPDDFYLNTIENNLIPTDTDQIAISEVFNLTYKGRNITPSKINSISRLTSKFSFNQNLKNYNSMYPFFAEINEIIPYSNSNQAAPTDSKNLTSQQVNLLIQTYLDLSKENPDAVKPFKNIIETKGLFILALGPDSPLYPLKEKFISIFKLGTDYQMVASHLEDLYTLYNDNDFLIIDKILSELEVLVKELSVEEAKSAIIIVDNILDITPKANSEEMYDFRNLFAEKLSNPLDRTLFRIKTIQHLERLESMIASNSITTSQIKKSVQILIKTLDLQSQTEYQKFLNNLE